MRLPGTSLIQDVLRNTKSPAVIQAADRFRTVEQNIDLFTPAELHQYIDLAAIERSLEQEQSLIAQRLLLVRNVLFVITLILTFAALGWSFIQYQAYVASHPQDANQSFLFLWQTGFNTGSTWFAASTIIISDACLFLVGGIVGIISGLLRSRGKKRDQALLKVLEGVMEDLSNLSLKRRGPTAPQPQVLNQVNLALQESVKITQNVQVQIVQVAQQMSAFQQSTSSLSQSLIQFEEESRTSASRLEAAQERNTQNLATFVIRMDGIRVNLDELAKGVITTLTSLEGRFNQAVQAINTTGVNLDRTAISLDTLGRSLTTVVAQFSDQLAQLTQATQITMTSTQQLTDSTHSLDLSQQKASQVIQEMLQRLSGVIRETSSSSAALARLADTGADTMRVASSMVTRLEIIQQLLGRLVTFAGVGPQGDAFLRGLLEPGQGQQNLGINPLRILSLLQTSGPQPMQELMVQVQELEGQIRLDPTVFRDVLTTFRDMDLVTLNGKSGNEQVKLTALGEQITGTLVSP